VTEGRFPIRMFVYGYEPEGSVRAGNFLIVCVLTCQGKSSIVKLFSCLLLDQFTVKQGVMVQREIRYWCTLSLTLALDNGMPRPLYL
jgi:hypothetical protein